MKRNDWLAHDKFGHVTTHRFSREDHAGVVEHLGTFQTGFRGRDEEILVYWTWLGLFLAHLMALIGPHRGKRVVWWVDIQI